jgi:hypothetical protein
MDTIVIDKCPDENCYNLPITYKSATMDQITALIDMSEFCYQEIHFSCYLSRISKNASWIDRHGDRQTYFTGAHYGKNICDCMVRNDCFSLAHVNQCNCDNADTISRHDSGRITNMVKLLFLPASQDAGNRIGLSTISQSFVELCSTLQQLSTL